MATPTFSGVKMNAPMWLAVLSGHFIRTTQTAVGPGGPAFMINYRVANLGEMLDRLRQSGVPVEKIEDHDYGRFAWLTDPEGNRIELWEPKSK